MTNSFASISPPSTGQFLLIGTRFFASFGASFAVSFFSSAPNADRPRTRQSVAERSRFDLIMFVLRVREEVSPGLPAPGGQQPLTYALVAALRGVDAPFRS